MLLHEKLKEKKLILASKSPRRRQLIEGAGLEYTLADGYDVDEIYPAELEAESVPAYLAELKSKSYPHRLADDEILITADTVVIIDGRIIGKPKDRSDAVGMITAISGRRHTVITGVTIRNREKVHTFSVSTDVNFRRLTLEEIEYYVDTYGPYDKAGAYGIQEWVGYVGIESVAGSFYNVMGLPIQSLYTNLNKFIEE